MTFDFKNFGDFIVLLTAIVGLISTIYNFIVKPTSNNEKPTEVSNIKFLLLQRQPVGLLDWWKLEIFYALIVVGSLSIIAVSGSQLYFYFSLSLDFNQTIRLLVYCLSLLFGIYLVSLYSYLLLKMGRSSGRPGASQEEVEANIFLFKCAEVHVRGNYDAVFGECERALRNLDASIVTLNYDNGILRGVVTRFLGGILNIGGTLDIKIAPLQMVNAEQQETALTPAMTSDDYTLKRDGKQGGLLQWRAEVLSHRETRLLSFDREATGSIFLPIAIEIQTLPYVAEQTSVAETMDSNYCIEVSMTRGFSLFKVTANSSRIIIHFIEQFMGKQ